MVGSQIKSKSEIRRTPTANPQVHLDLTVLGHMVPMSTSLVQNASTVCWTISRVRLNFLWCSKNKDYWFGNSNDCISNSNNHFSKTCTLCPLILWHLWHHWQILLECTPVSQHNHSQNHLKHIKRINHIIAEGYHWVHAQSTGGGRTKANAAIISVIKLPCSFANMSKCTM